MTKEDEKALESLEELYDEEFYKIYDSLEDFEKGELNDSLNATEDLSKKGHWGSGDYRIWLKTEDDLEYTISLVKQSYQNQL